MASRAPSRAVACAIAHAIDRLFATPTTSPCLPAKVTGVTSAPALAAGATGTGASSRSLSGPAAAAPGRSIPAVTLALRRVRRRAGARAALSRAVARALAWSVARAAKARRLSGRLSLALSLTRRTVAAIALAVVALRVEPAPGARRAHGEIGRLALWGLPFRTRQGGPDQRAMDGPLVVIAVGCRLRVGVGIAIDRVGICDRSRRRLERLRLVEGFRLVKRFFVRHGILGVTHGRPRARAGIEVLGGQRARLAAAGRRHLGLFVLVVRVARRAARLLDGILNHRDNHVIGNAALARTIVVENVTEPNPALLHELPRSRFRQVGFAKESAGCPGSVTKELPNPKSQIPAPGVSVRPDPLPALLEGSAHGVGIGGLGGPARLHRGQGGGGLGGVIPRSEEHTSELQSPCNLVCRLLL